MKLRILSREKAHDGAWVVRFAAAAGEGCARWVSSEAPVSGAVYSAELDVDITVNSDSARPAAAGSCCIRIDGDQVALEGQIEAVDPDGMGYLRLAPDSLVMVEVAPTWDRARAWVAITLQPDQITLTPVGVSG